jgi:hypothetical protein
MVKLAMMGVDQRVWIILIPRIMNEIAVSHQKHKVGSEYVFVKAQQESKRLLAELSDRV